MPEYKVTTPDGKQFVIRSDRELSESELFRSAMDHPDVPQVINTGNKTKPRVRDNSALGFREKLQNMGGGSVPTNTSASGPPRVLPPLPSLLATPKPQLAKPVAQKPAPKLSVKQMIEDKRRVTRQDAIDAANRDMAQGVRMAEATRAGDPSFTASDEQALIARGKGMNKAGLGANTGTSKMLKGAGKALGGVLRMAGQASDVGGIGKTLKAQGIDPGQFYEVMGNVALSLAPMLGTVGQAGKGVQAFNALGQKATEAFSRGASMANTASDTLQLAQQAADLGAVFTSPTATPEEKDEALVSAASLAGLLLGPAAIGGLIKAGANAKARAQKLPTAREVFDANTAEAYSQIEPPTPSVKPRIVGEEVQPKVETVIRNQGTPLADAAKRGKPERMAEPAVGGPQANPSKPRPGSARVMDDATTLGVEKVWRERTQALINDTQALIDKGIDTRKNGPLKRQLQQSLIDGEPLPAVEQEIIDNMARKGPVPTIPAVGEAIPKPAPVATTPKKPKAIKEPNAVQEPKATQGVLRQERPQVGLPKVGEGNPQATQAKAQEVTPITSGIVDTTSKIGDTASPQATPKPTPGPSQPTASQPAAPQAGGRPSAPRTAPETPTPTPKAPEPVKPAEAAPGERIGPSQARVEEMRREIGVPEYVRSAAKSDNVLRAEAQKARQFADSRAMAVMSSKDGVLKDFEQLALADELADSIDKMDAARKANDTALYDQLSDRAELLADALDTSGSRQGRAFRARRFVKDNLDDAWRIEREIIKRSGKDAVTPQVRERVTKVADEIKETKEKIAKARAKGTETAATVEYKNIRERIKRFRTREELAAERDRLTKELLQEVSKLSANPFADPELAKKIKDLVVVYAETGMSTLEDVVLAMQKSGLKITKAELAEVLAQPGKPRPPMTEGQKNTARIKAQARRGAFVKKEVATIEQEIRTGEFREKLSRVAPEKTAEEKALERKLEKLRRLRDEIIEAQVPQTFSEKARIIMRALRLSNPMNRVKDLGSNTVNTSVKLADNNLAALSDRIIFRNLSLSDGPANIRTTRAQMQFTAKGAVKRIWEEMGNQMNYGDMDAMAKYGLASDLRTKSERLNKVINTINRFAGVTDVPFKDMVYRSTLYELAQSAAIGSGIPKDQLQDAIIKIIRSAEEGGEFADLSMLAHNEALEHVFANKSAGVKAVDAFVSGLGPKAKIAFDLVAPFSRIFINMSGQSTDRLFGALKAIVKIGEIKSSGKSFTIEQRREINKLFARNLSGLALYAMGYYASQNGYIQAGLKGVRDKYLDWGILEDLGGPLNILILGATDQTLENLKIEKDGAQVAMSDEDKARIKNGAYLDLWLNQPIVSGPKRLLSKIEQGRGGDALGSIAAGAVIPGVVREAAKQIDTAKERGFPYNPLDPVDRKSPKGGTFWEQLRAQMLLNLPVTREGFEKR